ncbi:hypothetical protein L228DRAFT_41545 [Xylona heveae TC161]|uniref:FAR1 domain-containing protein n=1 Tax=Xylona heveae (strain CBS 132557 / TC161) TaxID=1328760 RepID=A0A164ZNW7_XYLHT|nr:hypothetical protein L228DRAFT_41545 [Xylona heveae TC161]KZF19324.1 hypothetical protein L228DRAFT_41545 [Xylona heveae TC161]
MGLLNNPPELGAWRQRLFALDEPVIIPYHQFEVYWPYVDNVWVRNKARGVKGTPLTNVYYSCRLCRKDNAGKMNDEEINGSDGRAHGETGEPQPPQSAREEERERPEPPGPQAEPGQEAEVHHQQGIQLPQPTAAEPHSEPSDERPAGAPSEGNEQYQASLETDQSTPRKRTRVRAKREGGTCQARLKMVYDARTGAYTITRYSEPHTHDLRRSDQVKRPSALMNIMAAEGAKNYEPAEIMRVMLKRDPDGRAKLDEAGGAFLTRTDVKNAGYKARRMMSGPDSAGSQARQEEGPPDHPIDTSIA